MFNIRDLTKEQSKNLLDLLKSIFNLILTAFLATVGYTVINTSGNIILFMFCFLGLFVLALIMLIILSIYLEVLRKI